MPKTKLSKPGVPAPNAPNAASLAKSDAQTRALTSLKQRANHFLKTWTEAAATNTPSFEAAGVSLKEGVSIRRDLKALLDPEIQQAKADLKLKQSLYKSVDNLLLGAEEAIRASLERYAALQRTRQAAAVESALSKGNDVKAASLAAKPFTPDVAGLSFTEHWHAEVTDLRLLLQAVIDGKISTEAVQENLVFLNVCARAEREKLSIPGVKAVKDTSSTMRAP